MSEPKPKKRGRGRPVTYGADIKVGLRFDQDTVDAAWKLAQHWVCTENEAIRRAVKQTAKRLIK